MSGMAPRYTVGLVLLAAVTGPLAAGCSVRTEIPDDSTLRCEQHVDCPAGWSCAAAVQRCFLGTTPSAEPPQVESATAPSTFSVEVSFDQPMAPMTLASPQLYTITAADGRTLPVHEASALDGSRVTLRTDEQEGAMLYTIVVASGPTDVWGNALDSAARGATFSGTGVAPERSAPTPIAPIEDERVIGLTAVLAWTPRLRATQYTVEVETAAGPLSGSPFTTREPFLSITLTEATRHAWRVRADVTEPEAWGQSAFEAFDDAVYVSCAVDADCSANAGNRGAPLGSIKRAMSLADALGLRTVRIAGRPEAYDEGSLDLIDGVSLRGSFSGDFVSQDASAMSTTIVGRAPITMQAVGLTQDILLEGLTVVGVDAVEEATTTAFLCIDCTPALTVRSSRFVGGQSEVGLSLGVGIVGQEPLAPGPHFEDVRIDGGEAIVETIALQVVRAAPTLAGLSITGGGSEVGASTVLESLRSAINLSDSTLTSGPAAMMAVLRASEETGTFSNNLFVLSAEEAVEGSATNTELSLCAATFSGNELITDLELTASARGFGGELVVLRLDEDASTFDGDAIGGGRLTADVGPLACEGYCPPPTAQLTTAIIGSSSTTFTDVTFDGGTLTALADQIRATVITLSLSEGTTTFTGCSIEGGHAVAAQGTVVGLETFAWTGHLAASTVSIDENAGQEVTAITLGGNTSPALWDNTVTVGDGAPDSVLVGLTSLSAPALITRNTISVGSGGATLGILSWTDQGGISEPLLVANNVVSAGDAAEGDSVAMKILGTTVEPQYPNPAPDVSATPILVTHNTLVAHSASLGRSIALHLERPQIVEDTMVGARLTNNLLVTDATVGATICILAETPVPTIRVNECLPISVQHNALVGCTDLFAHADDTTIDPACAFDSGFECLPLSSINDPALSTRDGATPEASVAGGNVFFAEPAALALGTAQSPWQPSGTSPTTLTGGGLAASSNLCGDGSQSCGAVDEDRLGTSRSCGGAGDCFAIGAFEP